MKDSPDVKLALVVGIATLILAGGCYLGLMLLTGGKKTTQKVEGVTADKMVSQNAAGAPTDAAAATGTEVASTDTTGADSTGAANAAATTAPAADPVAAAADAAASAVASKAGGSGPLTAEEAKKIGEDVARQVATQVAQQIVNEQLSKGGAAAPSGGLTAEEARKIGAEEGRRVAEEVTTKMIAANGSGASSAGGLSAAQAEQIGLAAGRRAAKQVAAKTAREVVRSEFGGHAVARSAIAPGAATETAAAEPASAAVHKGHAHKASGSSGRHSEAGADALRAWWPATSSGEFGLVYAGQPKGEGAIALLFSNTPNSGALGEGVKVYDAKGKVVSGTWEAAANPRLVVFRGVKPGRYTVVVAPTLADSSGKAISRPAHGPVYITT